MREIEPPARVWRVVPRTNRPTCPAWVVGKLVHTAIRRWCFPDAPDFEVFLCPHALEAGLTDQVEIANAMRQARHLMERFRTHPLWAEMNAAERWHELPYALADDAGIIDMLYRNGDMAPLATWTVADFKTDEICYTDQVARRVIEDTYDEQLRRYADAVEAQLGRAPPNDPGVPQCGGASEGSARQDCPAPYRIPPNVKDNNRDGYITLGLKDNGEHQIENCVGPVVRCACHRRPGARCGPA